MSDKASPNTCWLIELRPAAGSDQTKISYYMGRDNAGRPTHTLKAEDAKQYPSEEDAKQAVGTELSGLSAVAGKWAVAQHTFSKASGFHASVMRPNSPDDLRAMMEDMFTPSPGGQIIGAGFGGPMFEGEAFAEDLPQDSVCHEDFDMWLAALKRVKQANVLHILEEANLDAMAIEREDRPTAPWFLDVGEVFSDDIPENLRAAFAIAINPEPSLMLVQAGSDGKDLDSERLEALRAAGILIWFMEDDEKNTVILLNMGDYYI